MNIHQKTAIAALEQMRGDDLQRARFAWRGLGAAEMNSYEYGISGKTRAMILAEYEAHNEKIDAAIKWVKEAK